MAIEKRGDRWWIRFNFDGRVYRSTTGLPATRQYANAAAEMEVKRRQQLRDGERGTGRLKVRQFSDAAVEFLEWARAEHKAKPNTWRRLAVSMTSLTAFFSEQPVCSIQSGDLDRFKARRVNVNQVRDVTVRHDLHALSRFFQFAMRQRWARENPVRAVVIPSDAASRRDRVITPAEETAYFAVARGPLAAVARLMLLQGLRPDEAMRLCKSDVDLEAGRLKVRDGKTAAAKRELRLTNEARVILARRAAASAGDWIFPSARRPGEHLSKLNAPHNRVCEVIGLDVVLYDFRHTFATRMAQAGVDLVTLAAILGHGSLRTVQRYVHPSQEHQDAAMLRYDALQRAIERESAESAATLGTTVQ